MGIHVEIKLDLSSKSKRRLKSAAVVAASIAIVGVGVAIASIDTSWVQDGQPVSASSLKANLDGLQAQITAQAMPVGSIVPSLLMEAQFQAVAGNGWVLADGRSVAGSAYAVTTGNNNIPDLRGMFLRGRNSGGSTAGVRGDGNENPDGVLALGTTQGDMFASHSHGYIHPWSGGAMLDPSTPGQQTGGKRDVSHSSDAAGGNETRPKNVTVNYFLRIN